MTNQYNPDTVSPPGDTLWDWMESNLSDESEYLGWVESNLGLTWPHFMILACGFSEITPDLAQKLEQATSIPASFWLERERRYREAMK